ncbi:uncharacterized protein LOC119836628 [Zerene cesonia]|uniref:uncharacterized protein LOC119836628 n=1 Tax=Zerene cesonia TaxID=33412 RepID=UPI0018E50977|nr:uncharacterized protein LOC119836628 [Zerene cesonia]
MAREGVAIIDFESWRPVFRQNFGVLVPYKDVSYEIERKMHWWWPKSWITTEAKQRFEESARRFMQNTISTAKQLRPKGIWGYYGFPYCFNKPSSMIESCPNQVVSENDETYWLWAESTALYPSVYSSQDLSSSELASLIQGRMREASRLRRRGTPILPYFWYRYQDGGFLREQDLSIALQSLYKSNASGVIIWGSSNDVNTVEKCNKLKRYVQTTLGPYIARYTKDIHKIKDDYTPEPTDVWDLKPNLNKTQNTIPDQDPEYNWIPPENYTHEIINNVEQELMKKGYEEFNRTNLVNESIIFEMLLNSRPTEEIEKEMTKNDKNVKIEMTSEATTSTTGTTTELVSTLDNNYTETTQQTTESVDSTTDYTIVQYSTTESLQIDSTTSQALNNDELFENYKIYDDQFENDKIDDERFENDKIDDDFFVLFTNVSQIDDITTEESISSKRPRSVGDLDAKSETTTEYFEDKFLENSTFHLLTPAASDEEGDFSNAAISSNNFVYTIAICVIFMYI